MARRNFRNGENLVIGEELDVFNIKHMSKSVRSGLEVFESASFRLGNPRIVIAVSVENDALMLFYRSLDKIMESTFKVFCSLKFICKLLEFFRNGSVENGVCTGN